MPAHNSFATELVVPLCRPRLSAALQTQARGGKDGFRVPLNLQFTPERAPDRQQQMTLARVSLHQPSDILKKSLQFGRTWSFV